MLKWGISRSYHYDITVFMMFFSALTELSFSLSQYILYKKYSKDKHGRDSKYIYYVSSQ